eukprot:scaffold52376_cov23-Tisochrysis_lutea.AAC.2
MAMCFLAGCKPDEELNMCMNGRVYEWPRVLLLDANQMESSTCLRMPCVRMAVCFLSRYRPGEEPCGAALGCLRQIITASVQNVLTNVQVAPSFLARCKLGEVLSGAARQAINREHHHCKHTNCAYKKQILAARMRAERQAFSRAGSGVPAVQHRPGAVSGSPAVHGKICIWLRECTGSAQVRVIVYPWGTTRGAAGAVHL